MKKWAYLLCVICSTGYAAQWEVVGIGNSVDVVASVDLNSIRMSGTNRKAWVLWNYREPEVNASRTFAAHSAKYLYLYNCKNRSIAKIQRIYYTEPNGGGKSYADSYGAAIFQEVAPDTLGEALLNFVCTYPLKPN